jgi:hypothetical protein
MSLRVQDGTGGQEVALSCDNCGAELRADSFDDLNRLRVMEGWSPSIQRPDLCRECHAERAARRFRRD